MSLTRGSSYLIKDRWYEVVWSGEKYSYCSSYNQKNECYEKQLLKNSELEKGEYCPF